MVNMLKYEIAFLCVERKREPRGRNTIKSIFIFIFSHSQKKMFAQNTMNIISIQHTLLDDVKCDENFDKMT